MANLQRVWFFVYSDWRLISQLSIIITYTADRTQVES